MPRRKKRKPIGNTDSTPSSEMPDGAWLLMRTHFLFSTPIYFIICFAISEIFILAFVYGQNIDYQHDKGMIFRLAVSIGLGAFFALLSVAVELNTFKTTTVTVKKIVTNDTEEHGGKNYHCYTNLGTASLPAFGLRGKQTPITVECVVSYYQFIPFVRHYSIWAPFKVVEPEPDAG